MEFNKEVLFQKILPIKDKLDAKLLAHPLFMEQLDYLCSKALGLLENVHDYKVYISQDGQKIEFVVEGEHKGDTRDNKQIYCGEISMNGDALSVTSSQGTLYRSSDLRKEGQEIIDKCDSKLYTYYDNFMYDDKGICLSWSSYMDSYPLTFPMEYTNLREQVLSNLHKPTFSYNLPPVNPMFYNNATAHCMHRTYDNLGVVYENYIRGINPNSLPSENRYDICQVNTERPERLIAIPCPIATWSNDERKFVNSGFHSLLEGKTVEEILEEMKENFVIGVEHSKTKEYNPEMYENLLEATRYSKSK